MQANSADERTLSGCPAVTVIIPNYNRQRLLKRAVESVFLQDVDFELIVVDDASPEPSAKALRTYQDDPRLRIIRHQANRGGGAARNTGIARARGRYIAFLDSDDYWLPNKLEAALSYLRKQPDVSTTVVFHRTRILTPFGERLSNDLEMGSRESIGDFLFVRGGQIQTSCVVLPTALSQKVLFDPRLERLQDWDFYLRLEHAGAKFIRIPTVHSVYDANEAPDRISAQCNSGFLLDWLEERRNQLSCKAQLGFLANKVVPELIMEGKKKKAAFILVRAYLNGVITQHSMLIELLRMSLPKGGFDTLRRIKNSIV